MAITEEEVRHVADLARLKLTDDEVKEYAQQMSDILDYFKDLDEVNTEGVKVTSQVTGLKNVFREDEVISCDEETRKRLIREAPDFRDGYFVVPNSIKKHR